MMTMTTAALPDTDWGHWINGTGLKNPDLSKCIGFIYVIHTQEWFYIGRKQFYSGRSARTRRLVRWNDYESSSKTVQELVKKEPATFKILAIFESRSYLSYGEAVAIVTSRSIERDTSGVNGEIEKFRSRCLSNNERDAKQLLHLKKECTKLAKQFIINNKKDIAK